MNLYAWDAERKAWETAPIATSDRVVWGKGKLWQHNLTLFAEKGTTRADTWNRGKPSLPRGRYRVEIRVDKGGRAAKDWAAGLGAKDIVGRVEVTSDWPEGYGKMTAVDASKTKK